MNAMQMIQRDRFEIEAQAWCAEHMEQYTEKDVIGLAGSLRHQAFLQEVRPLLDAKCRIYNCTLPKITIDRTGHVETVYEFPESLQKSLDELDMHISDIAKKYGAGQKSHE